MIDLASPAKPQALNVGSNYSGPVLNPIRVLAYVHLRNIHNSTGAGRVARQLTSHLAARPDVSLQVLADRGDYARIIPEVGAPWNGYEYHFFASDTSLHRRAGLAESPSCRIVLARSTSRLLHGRVLCSERKSSSCRDGP